MKRLHITATNEAVFSEPAPGRLGRGIAEELDLTVVVAPSNAEIMARLAKRRVYNEQAVHEERAAHATALDEHVRSKCAELGIGLDVLEHPTSRAELMRSFKGSFKPKPDLASADKIAVHRLFAAQELPDAIKSERWATGDCKCVVERIYHRDAPHESQTFHAEPCADHDGLAIDELHDVMEEETLRRASVHRWLDEQGVDLSAFAFAWSGKGAARLLIVQGVALDDEQAKGLEAFGAVEVAAGV